MQYDIIQVEDDSQGRRFLEGAAKGEGLTYLGVGCLHDLENVILESAAQIYVVDGRFPISKNGPVDRNAYKTIEAIRDKYPDSKIIIYSAELQGENIAKDNSVEFRSKQKYTAYGLIDEIQKIISS